MVFAGRRRQASSASAVTETVPVGLRIAAAYSWRILLVAGLAALVVFLVIQLRYIVIPLLVAVLLSALLVPFSSFLQRHRTPKWLAVLVSMLGTILVIGALVTVVVLQVRSDFENLRHATATAIESLRVWLSNGPLQVDSAQINAIFNRLWSGMQQDTPLLLSGVMSFGSTAGHLFAGTLLALFATLFILIDGRHIWRWVLRLFPRRARPAVGAAAESGWVTLTAFAKVQIFVAFVDAVGIGVGAWILGLFYGGFPLVIPIAVAVFLGSFIPIVGALATGALAVFVALVYLGPIPALIMLGIVLLVHQVEGHVLQPLVMGSAVRIHPLAVVIAVAAGGFIAGIPGALFAVPIVAVANVMVVTIASGSWREHPHPTLDNILEESQRG